MPEIDYIAEYYSSRKAIIEREFSNLNDKQKEAVFTTEGPLLVLAGAGSGKTTVLVSRIAYLMKYGNAYMSDEIPPEVTAEDIEYLMECRENPDMIDSRVVPLLAVNPAPPWSILAITFTNKAASEMKNRIRKSVGSAADEVWASTFHSSCVRILRRYADRIYYNKGFTIYDSEDSQTLMKNIMKDYGVSNQFTPKSVLGEISRAKDRLITPALFAESIGSDYRLSVISKLYNIYQAKLREAEAMDFDDLIGNTVLLLQNNPDVLEYYHRKFKYVLVDEYQDTNIAQYKLTHLLSSGSDNLCVVGDDDQSIYRFRGATIENILTFEKNYNSSKSVKLEQNYRSTKNILGAANGVIEHNIGRKGKDLWTAGGEGDKVTIYTAEDGDSEAAYIAGEILKSVSGGGKWSDNAVLYRMNAQSNSIERALRENAMPYRMVGGTRFYDRAEIRDILAFLHVIANPMDELRLQRIINVPARGISNTTIETARGIAASEGLPLPSVLRNSASYEKLARPTRAIAAFFSLIDSLSDFAQTNALPELYDELLDRTGYRRFYEVKTDDDSKNRIDNIDEFKSNIINYVLTHESPSLDDFLAETALIADIDKYDTSADAITLMTIHNAKGLEFDSVYICGMEEDIFPSFRSTSEPESIEEERRLAYVGITRAKKHLTLVCANHRLLFGRTSANMPSRFLGEIPREFATIASKKRREVRQTRGESYAERGTRSAKPVPPSASESSLIPNEKAETRNFSITDFKKGVNIVHKVFGKGVITAALPMGSDLLLTIGFEDGNIRKFLAKSTAQYIKII